MTATVQLPSDEVAAARSWDRLIMRMKRMRPDGNYTGLHAQDRFFHGYLGELAVARWLSMNRLEHRHFVCLTGRHEDNEFVLGREDGEWLTLEVKTASAAHHTHFMYPAAQSSTCADINVAARIERIDAFGARVTLAGWLERERAANLPIKEVRIPTRMCRFSEMRRMADLPHRMRVRTMGALADGCREVVIDPRAFEPALEVA